MKIMSSAFEAGADIPTQYTCEGDNISPPLEWQGIPVNAENLALICDDPDAPEGPFSHWVLYAIPTEKRSLAAGVEQKSSFNWGGRQGRNDFGEVHYGGPCPPLGEKHRYYWRLYALDIPCDLPPGATRAQLLEWMEGHKIAQAELMGRYQRS